MKKILFVAWTAAVAIGLILILGDLAFSDDVYNFYWQKGTGPTTVIQGGAPPQGSVRAPSENDPNAVVQTTPATAIPVATTATATAPPPETKEEVPPKFAILAGYTVFNDDAGSGTGAALGFRWMPLSFFGTEAQVIYAPPSANSGYSAMSPDGYNYNYTTSSPFRYQLGIVLTPFRLKIFGADMLSISALAGGTTYTAFNWSTYNNETDIGGYVGAEVGIELGRTIAIVGQAKTVVLNQKAQQQPTQYVAGLSIRF